MKPFLVEKAKGGWHLFLNVPAAYAYAPRRNHKSLAPYPAQATRVPLTELANGKVDFAVDSIPLRLLTKTEAIGLAHSFGRYKLDLGDFVFSYVEESTAE